MIEKIKYSPKKEGAPNRLREDTALRKSGDRALCLKPLDCQRPIVAKHFRYLSCLSGVVEWYFRGKIDSEIRGQVIHVQT